MRKSDRISRLLSRDFMSVVIAICAILISGASFYATYLQAQAAEKQVKAMTMPLIRFGHENYDEEKQTNYLNFEFENAGVGPAIVESVSFLYKGKEYPSMPEVIKACCSEEGRAYRERFGQFNYDNVDVAEGGLITSPLQGVIIPGQSNYEFWGLYAHENSNEFWQKVNEERRNIHVRVCYCSLLGDCFETKEGNAISEIEACPAVFENR